MGTGYNRGTRFDQVIRNARRLFPIVRIFLNDRVVGDVVYASNTVNECNGREVSE